MFDGFSSAMVVVDHIHVSLTMGSFAFTHVTRTRVYSTQTARLLYYALSLN